MRLATDQEIRERFDHYTLNCKRHDLADVFNSHDQNSDRVNGHQLTRADLIESILGHDFEDMDVSINRKTGTLTITRITGPGTVESVTFEPARKSVRRPL